jgi:cation:H+ antiporter
VLGGVLATLLAAAWLRLNLRERGVPVWALLVNGTLYAAYLGFMLHHPN